MTINSSLRAAALATAPFPRMFQRALFALLLAASGAQAAQFTINGPPGSGEFGTVGAFGTAVVTLPNGNIVVTDPSFDAAGGISDVGAVYLYRPDGTLISTLRGSTFSDNIGFGGVVVLANGNYVVRSPFWKNSGAVTFGSGVSGISGVVSAANSLVGAGFSRVTALSNGNYVVGNEFWNNGGINNAGAATFGSGLSGVSGVVSSTNSLVGSSTDAQVGRSVTALSNGNYVVSSGWSNGAIVGVGAVTFGSGLHGISGVVSSANSLVGSTAGDRIGGSGVTPLSNGNYVVGSPSWHNGASVDAGAATFGSGLSGISGEVSATNSLVGSADDDRVGRSVTPLSNGNYVVTSEGWNNGAIRAAGAVTFGSGIGGISGVVSAANSLVGSTVDDQVGAAGVTALNTGNYVVASSRWSNNEMFRVGAATFGSGLIGISGAVSSANSLIGRTAFDQVGTSVTALSNGNYVVSSPGAFNGAGAATFGSGQSGISGVVSPSKSLVGSTQGDVVGNGGVTALSNGNYVVTSSFWNNGAIVGAGAVTFGSGLHGISGVVSSANSLVGSTAGDRIGGSGVTALSNGNYVVTSPRWNNGAIVEAGAATFGSGQSGISGVVSPANSLVGSTQGDSVSFPGLSFNTPGVIALSTGDYVVTSPSWNNGMIVDAGAATFGSGASGVSGMVSQANSLTGNTAFDFVSSDGVTALSNGNYVVPSLGWDNGEILDAGAITLGLSDSSVTGTITTTHSVLGTVGGGFLQVFDYDPLRNQLAVGQPASNRVVLHRTGIATLISIVGNTPNPSVGGEPVIFAARVSASNAPTNGQVTFSASGGQSCVDTTPTVNSATTASYSCTIVFTAGGTSSVIAEYTGSIIHAYSGSAPQLQTTTVEDLVFADGFEGL